MPLGKEGHVYKYPGHLPTKSTVAKLLEISVDKVQMVCPGSVEGVSRPFIETYLKRLAEEKKWSTFNKVFALAIYGTILFPFAVGLIDLYAISVFQMVEYHGVNPVPAILAETYLTLSHCHDNGGGKIRCCLHLLNVWVMSHLYGKKLPVGEKDNYSNPLTIFKDREGKVRLDRKGWIEVFNQLRAKNVTWRMPWWWSDEIICRCGSFPNIPLLGPRGCINYNPMLLLKQFAFSQKIPSEEVVQRLQFIHDDSTRALSQKVGSAWDRVVSGGRLEFGVRLISESEEYQAWLTARIKGANPAFALSDPLLDNPIEANKELVKQLEKRDVELEKLTKADCASKQALAQLQEEYANLQNQMKEMKRKDALVEGTELRKLKGENLELKRTIRDMHKDAEENKQRLKDSRIRLMRATKEKDALEKEVRDLHHLRSLSQEVEKVTKQLEEKVGELASVRRDSSATIQRLLEQVHQQTEAVEDWKALYSRKAEEVEQWRERAERLISVANDIIPRFSDVYVQFERSVHPFNTSPEITDFLALCNDVVVELRALAQSW